MSQKISKSLATRLARIKLFLCDMDGILTDGAVFIGGPQEIKRFNIRDGLGLVILRREGIKVGWISNRISSATQLRGEELKIDFLHQTKESKVGAVEQILRQTGFSWDEVCYMGDDIVDIGVLRRAGLAATVADATMPAKKLAHYVTKTGGGHGAVREVVEMILKAQGKWPHVLAGYEA